MHIYINGMIIKMCIIEFKLNLSTYSYFILIRIYASKIKLALIN